jgi:2-polyprenyl-6-methoxyphenol hydroxylase-like FAD-dependent oxidoreductase
MAHTTKTAIIIGGGIGGTVAAMFLKRAGIDAQIYEAQPAPNDNQGYFLNVASNGLDVLHTLGLEAQVTAEGFAIPRMIMWNGSGKRLGEVRNGAAPGQGAESVVLKRGALHRILREAALRQGVLITWGKALAEIDVSADGAAIARFADGTNARGDFLIGSDGLHSRTRQIIAPNAPKPSYTGLISCGGYAHNTSLAPTPDTQHFIFGKRAFFGYFVKPSGEIYWFNNMAYPGAPRRSELEAIPSAEWQRRLLDIHRDDPAFIQEIIYASAGDIGAYPIYDVPSTPTWHAGPIVLLGDAAHAMSPSAGQGSSLAMEDAITLAKCVRDLPVLEDAFAAYEQLRRERAERAVKFSRARGNNKAASSPLARWFRDLLLPFFLKAGANPATLDWVYTYKVDWEAPLAEVSAIVPRRQMERA